jgi:small subunit ribosomal protein S20
LTHASAFEFLASSNLSNVMANTKSAIKAARKTVRLTERNRGVKTRLKTLRKRLDTLVAAKDDAGSKTAAAEYVSAMDKAVKSGVVHRNAASRAKAYAAKVFATKK